MHYLEFGLRIYVAYPCDFCVTAFFSQSCLWCFGWSWAEEENREENKRRQPDISSELHTSFWECSEENKRRQPDNSSESYASLYECSEENKRNRLFYSPESYTSFQKCSVSIYWARKSCFTTLLLHWNTKPWNFPLTSSTLVSLLIIKILTLMFTVFLRTIAKY